MSRNLIALLVTGALLLADSGAVHAAQKSPYGPTDIELASLPPFCTARIRGDKAAKKQWNDSMGRENFVHIHHYCFGLNFINRSRSAFDPKQRNYLLQQAIGNFNYVLRGWKPEFYLYQQALQMKSVAEMMRR